MPAKGKNLEAKNKGERERDIRRSRTGKEGGRGHGS